MTRRKKKLREEENTYKSRKERVKPTLLTLVLLDVGWENAPKAEKGLRGKTVDKSQKNKQSETEKHMENFRRKKGK